MEAGQFIETIERRQGLKVACLEEIAFERGWIDVEKLRAQAAALKHISYGDYLSKVATEQMGNTR